MSIFGSRSGSWWITSPSDERWRDSGHTSDVGGFTMPEDTTYALERLKEKFGEPPEDLEWGYMKD